VPVYLLLNAGKRLRVRVTVKGTNDVADEVNVTLDWSVAIDVVTEGVSGLKDMAGDELMVESLAA
jgi:hypothetical protein